MKTHPKPTDPAIPDPADGAALEAARALAEEFGIDCLDRVTDEMLDTSLIENLSVDWVRRHGLLPIRYGGRLCVLTADPSNLEGQEYLAMMVGEELAPVVAPRETVLRAIERCYFRREDSPDRYVRELGEQAPSEVETASPRSEDLLRTARETPVTQLVNLIILEAVKQHASDIHFEPFESRLRVRYRIDGVLYEQAAPPKHLEAAVISRLKVMARMDIAEKRLPQDGMARVRVGDREVDIRVSTVPAAEGERVVLRLLDRESALLPLEALGMPETLRKAFRSLLREPNGMIVVCGPTGSGKTTSLYAALSTLDASRKNIMTIEDPIEYQLPDIGQIQVKPKIGLTFATGLRHILRQDPDIILVGETRDLETAEIAMRAALTGHLVFTTLHTNDAGSSITRLVDMGVEPYLLASTLRGVLAQRLVRKLCTACRRETVIGAREAEGLGPAGETLVGRKTWAPVGCGRCLEGYSGRVGVFELLVLDEARADAIREGVFKTVADGLDADGLTLADDAIRKILDGTTSVAEVRRVLG